MILKLLVFAIPPTIAAILHMIIVKLDWLKILKYPLDFNQTYRNKRIFGGSKSFRGMIAMIIFSIFATYFLQLLCKQNKTINELNVINFQQYSAILIGIAFGLGYVLAELPNSFFKRIAGIEEGKRGNLFNILIDQADSPIGCMIGLIPFSNIDINFFISGTIFYLLLHMFFNVLLYGIGLRKNPL